MAARPTPEDEPHALGVDDVLDPVGAAVTRLLLGVLDARVAELASIDAGTASLGREVRRLVAGGGKRLRPAFVHWGAVLAGAEDLAAAHTVGAAVELVHTFALVHDDVIDRSATRRDEPTVHRALATTPSGAAGSLDADWFGVSGAILAGDIAFAWAFDLLDEVDLPEARRTAVRVRFRQMLTEVIAGQWLEIQQAHVARDGSGAAADPLRVALLKSGRYSVTRPLQMGVASVLDDPPWADALQAYGDAVGIAFQVRDDVLGLHGSDGGTGKGVVEDLREGRRTVLVAEALQRCDPADAAWLRGRLGAPDVTEDDAARAAALVAGCGALGAAEQLVDRHLARSLEAAAALPRTGRDALVALARLAAQRDR